MSDKLRVLLIEDNPALAENIFDYLGDVQYALDYAADGLSGLHLLSVNQYDVILLDEMLPGISGFDLCNRIRRDLQSNTPLIMVTAKDALADKETAFTRGADDYLVKPFSLRELQLRIDALCRRQNRGQECIQAAGLSYYPGRLLLESASGQSLSLSGTQASIFDCLIRAYPNIVTHPQLCETLWGDSDNDLHSLRTHVYSLRKQLKTAFPELLLKTIHGRGYQLSVAATPTAPN